MAVNNQCDSPSIQQPNHQIFFPPQKSSVPSSIPPEKILGPTTDDQLNKQMDDDLNEQIEEKQDNTILLEDAEQTLPIEEEEEEEEEETAAQAKSIHTKLRGKPWWLEQDLTCPICIEEIKGKKSLYTLDCDCKMAYDSNCMLNLCKKDTLTCPTCRRNDTNVIDIYTKECIKREMFKQRHLPEEHPATTGPTLENHQTAVETNTEIEMNMDTFPGPGQIRCHTCNYSITPHIVYDEMENYYRPSCPKCTVYQKLLPCTYCGCALAPNKTYHTQNQYYIASCPHCNGFAL